MICKFRIHFCCWLWFLLCMIFGQNQKSNSVKCHQSFDIAKEHHLYLLNVLVLLCSCILIGKEEHLYRDLEFIFHVLNGNFVICSLIRNYYMFLFSILFHFVIFKCLYVCVRERMLSHKEG